MFVQDRRVLARHWEISLLLDGSFVRWENSGGKGFRSLKWDIKEGKWQESRMVVKSLNVLRLCYRV